MNIIYTSWKSFNGHPIVQHNTILVNGIRCASLDIEKGGKALTFYSSANYDKELQPVSPSIQLLPKTFYEVLTSDGSNIDAFYAADKDREDFLLGYDERQLVCGGVTVFPAMTTIFLIRPFVRPVLIKNVQIPLDVGSVWMVVVPTYKNGTCLYQSNVPLMPEGLPLESMEASPDGDENQTVIASDDDDFSSYPEHEDDLLSSVEPQASHEEIIDGSSLFEEGVNGEPTVEAAHASPDDSHEGEESACFPAAARVTLRNGSVVRMDQLSTGDQVHVGAGYYTRVFGFTHADRDAVSAFVRLSTADGVSVSMSRGHYVYANGVTVAAEKVRVGDILTMGGGEDGLVAEVGKEMGRGLYNPQTLDGNIVVDGVKATTYTTAVRPEVGEAALAPVRALFRAGVCGLGVMKKGAPRWTQGLLTKVV